MYFNPKNKEIEHIFDRLINYPVIDIDGKTAQILSRYKQIRFINQNRKYPLIKIKGGMIGINPKLKIKKKGKGFEFNIF